MNSSHDPLPRHSWNLNGVPLNEGRSTTPLIIDQQRISQAMLLHGLEVVLSQEMCPIEKTNGIALAYAPTFPSVPLPTVMLWLYQEECVQRLLVAYERDRHGEELLVYPQLQAGEKKLVLVDRSAIWRSLPVDPHSKQTSWLRTFKIPH